MRKSLVVLGLILSIVAVTVSYSSLTKLNAASDASQSLTVNHELGVTQVPKNPERVIVFDFGVLDSLDRLGIDVIGLPKSSLPTYLSKFADTKYANVGSLKEPDFEGIYALKPDLIIISGRQAELYDEFSFIAPTIYMAIDTSRYMESFEENMRLIGKIFDQESTVEAELSRLREDIARLRERIIAQGKNALVTLANDGNVSAYGPGSRFGLIYDVFGFTPVDKRIAASTHGQNISFEYILANDPDYLFVIDRSAVVDGRSSVKQIVENQLVRMTQAYKEDRIVYLSPDAWYLSGGGLASMETMVNEVSAAVK